MEKEINAPVRALKAHLALNVKNVEKSLEFYRKMLGIEPAKVRTGYAKFDVENPPLNLTLNEVSFKERGALSHMGIQLASTDDVLAMRRTWAERGLTTLDEMQTNCCYALQDKTWVHDPDGNEWEAFVVLEDNLPQTTMCCASAETEEQQEAGGVRSKTDEAASCLTTPAAAAGAATCCGEASAAPVAISR